MTSVPPRKIWIDLANSPQVLFFRPIIQELERRGHSLFLTSRPFAQTTLLADQLGLRHTPVGRHGGKRISAIMLRVLERSWALARLARAERCDLAVSHNSYAQALAATGLRMPFVTLMDYEHQPANHVCFRLAQRVIVPECFPEASRRKYGASPRKTWSFAGTKEQVYLSDFVPQHDYLASIGVPPHHTVVVMRPPGTWGLYHNFQNPLFERVLEHVVPHRDTTIICLPRVASQAEAIRALKHPNVMVPEKALDGPNLLYAADVVISGGGTMNREAAVLGTPTYSVFKGQSAAVDRYLAERGRLTHIDDESGVTRIRIERKHRLEPLPGVTVVSEITNAILNPLPS